MDCSLPRPPGFSIHGIFEARILEGVAISFSRGSSQPRDQTRVSRIAGRLFSIWATREAICIRCCLMKHHRHNHSSSCIYCFPSSRHHSTFSVTIIIIVINGITLHQTSHNPHQSRSCGPCLTEHHPPPPAVADRPLFWVLLTLCSDKETPPIWCFIWLQVEERYYFNQDNDSISWTEMRFFFFIALWGCHQNLCWGLNRSDTGWWIFLWPKRECKYNREQERGKHTCQAYEATKEVPCGHL